MYVQRLECRRFRCLENLVFEPEPGLNCIRGGNAQGKTSVLEAVLFAATSKSHRTNVESELAQYGAEQFQLRLRVRRETGEVDIASHWFQGTKRIKVNGVPQARLSDLLGRVNVVLFSPEDVDLVKGGAAQRRRFLDMAISQVEPAYLVALQMYRQALRQRNELLRAAQPDHDHIAVWDAQLAQYGAVMTAQRAAFIEALSDHAARAYAQIAGAEPLALDYAPDVRPEESIAAVLERARASDIKRRVTQRGPHRDDFTTLVDARPARAHASQGQQKSAALAIRLAELALARQRIGEYPVLMLDEALAELDVQRARRLLEAIDPQVQCLITTTELEDRYSFRDAGCAMFRIERGRLEKE